MKPRFKRRGSILRREALERLRQEESRTRDSDSNSLLRGQDALSGCVAVGGVESSEIQAQNQARDGGDGSTPRSTLEGDDRNGEKQMKESV